MSELTALDAMFAVAPCDWWAFVGCWDCNAGRQEPCQTVDGPRVRPHVSRVRSGLVLHGTLWLLRNGYEADVLGDRP